MQKGKQMGSACHNKPRWTRIKILSFLVFYTKTKVGIIMLKMQIP